jgi:myb proto-oncogene protein
MTPSPPAAAPADIDDNDDADADPGTDTQANAMATGSWTSEEDAKLTSAVANTHKKKIGKEYKRDWVAVAALVPGRTRSQCKNRWRDALDPNVDRAKGRTGTWTEDEDSKLKDAVQMHGGKSWPTIATLVPGRTNTQCRHRWHNFLDPSIDWASGRTGKWAEDEDSKLRDAVQTHGDHDWAAIAALVPGRTKKQCWSRWHDGIKP